MKEFLRRLVILAIGFAIFLGTPIYFDNFSLLFLSWIPALIAMGYLDN